MIQCLKTAYSSKVTFTNILQVALFDRIPKASYLTGKWNIVPGTGIDSFIRQVQVNISLKEKRKTFFVHSANYLILMEDVKIASTRS